MAKTKSHPLKVARVILATLFFAAIIVLLSGVGAEWAPKYLGWTAKLQFMPAILALSAGAFIIVVLLTVLFGRLYCSVICPMGIMQDCISWLGRKQKKNRYTYSKPKTWLRYTVLVLFIAALVAGLGAIAAFIEPYSAFGRMVNSIVSPKGWMVPVVAGVTFIVIAVLAWLNGRTWCNTICPVGTLLGLLSRFSLFKPVIDTTKCNGCRKCARNCKAACIDPEAHSIDCSRCVVCFDCLGQCKQGAIKYRLAFPVKKAAAVSQPATKAECKAEPKADATDTTRRAFLAGSLLALGSAAVKAEVTKVDGGLATIIDKKIPERQTHITPPGSESARHMYAHCTACQLCVTSCPNNVLRPSTDLKHFMQPESSYEKGYCRPECTTCGDVCPVGAIKPLSVEVKSSTQIGHAVWVRENCVVLTDEVTCGNCERHCPTGAIQMVALEGEGPAPQQQGRRHVEDRRRKIPVIDVERCIGCGACENLCPARPFSAIYVEGHNVHKTI